MTFNELKELFQGYTGATDAVDNAQLALWLNEAELDLAYELGPVQEIELTVTAGQEYAPGDDWLTLVSAELEYQRSPRGTLIFSQGGTGKLYYRAMPALFTGADAEQASTLPAAAGYLPALFAAARYWDGESEGDAQEAALASRWLSYYYQGRAMIAGRLLAAGYDIEGWLIR